VNKSAYYLLVAGIGTALILTCLLLPYPVTQPLRKQTLEILGPVLRTVEAPVHFFGQMNGKLKTLDQAQAEVTRLRAQVVELELTNQLLTDKDKENKRLREMLGFQTASQYELLPCRVISREPSNWWSSVQINVGWENNRDLDQKYHGKYSLASDLPVVSPRGVVGKTGEVSQYVTDVILMVDPNCKISATLDGTHDQGIVVGQGNSEEGRPQVKVTYLPKNSQVAVGQFLLTSGLGPNFPAGLRLGTVTNVPPLKNEYPTFGLYREAIIEPTADLDQLDELFIVLGPKLGTQPETTPDATPSPDSSAAPEAPSSTEVPSSPEVPLAPPSDSAGTNN
jgi:rod shape-determining protein MreC